MVIVIVILILIIPLCLHWKALEATIKRHWIHVTVFLKVAFLPLEVVNMTMGCTFLALYLSNISITKWGTYCIRQFLVDYAPRFFTNAFDDQARCLGIILGRSWTVFGDHPGVSYAVVLPLVDPLFDLCFVSCLLLCKLNTAPQQLQGLLPGKKARENFLFLFIRSFRQTHYTPLHVYTKQAGQYPFKAV